MSNNLANLLDGQYKYDEAEPLYRRLSLLNRQFTLDHPVRTTDRAGWAPTWPF